MQRSKLYLNPKFSKLRTQLLRVLMENGVHAEATRAFQVERPVIDEKTFFWRALGHFQSDAIDRFLRLAGTDVTGAEENKEISSKIEGFDAVLVEFERLVIDGTDKVFSGARDFMENGARFRKFLGLREHESYELLASEAARAVKQGAVEIFIQGNLAGVEGRKGKVVTVLKFFPFEMKGVGGFFS